MFPRRIALITLGAVLGVAGCASSSEQVARNRITGTQCEALTDLDQRVQQLLTPSNIERVEPAYYEVPHFAGPRPLYVAGADIYIPAEAGINQAYLERVLSCYAASSSREDHAHDPLRAQGIRSISARESGQTFRVSIRGVDQASGKEIWKRAQALRKPAATIEIRQLGSSARSKAF
jgi:hypothetical protein